MWRQGFRLNARPVVFVSRERCVTMCVGSHDFGFEELGPLNLKNIARPIEAFVMRYETAVTVPKSVERALVMP